MSRQYIGARYVPVFADPLAWDITKNYDALTIVQNNNDTYTSKKAVPSGTAITNTEYWVKTGNYNAQLQEYIEVASEAGEKADEAIEKVNKMPRRYRIPVVTSAVTSLAQTFTLPESVEVKAGETVKATIFATQLGGTNTTGNITIFLGNPMGFYIGTAYYTGVGSGNTKYHNTCQCVANANDDNTYFIVNGSVYTPSTGETNDASFVHRPSGLTRTGTYNELTISGSTDVTKCESLVIYLEIG